VAEVFVFGSNLAGRHGKGAALYARRCYGAVYGVGEGRTGNAYAIPTKGHRLETLPLDKIKASLFWFAEYARLTPEDKFLLTPIGCGLAGYTREEIRPLVEAVNMPPNVVLTKEWNDG
jgi:hypothetical protein